MGEKIKLICVVGATASGKTALGVALAKALDGEIISADSMQVYKHMPIATAAATAEEQQGIPHYLLEFLEPEEPFSVADFVALAGKCIADIASRGKVPVIVGGTGLFIDSLVQGLQFSDVGADETLRSRLAEKTDGELYEKLASLDPAAAAAIHPNNRKRVIRALELYYGGTSKTRQNEQSRPAESPYDALYIQIDYADRQKLYDRIDCRVERMLQAGLADEARAMRGRTGKTARQAIGHKELAPYLDGALTLQEAAENLKRETRRYAKRQLTWFRRNENIYRLCADELGTEELVRQAVTLAKTFIQPS